MPDSQQPSSSRRTRPLATADCSLNARRHVVIEAGESFTVKVGLATLTMHRDGTIVLKGKDIVIDGAGCIQVKASKDVTIKGRKILDN